MRDVIYLNDKCYQRHTTLIEIETLAQLEQIALRNQTTLCEVLNDILTKGVQSYATSVH
ncbi:hypothetical protein [Stutzerimonas stutzeri]|uniref:hypothetical protein n=1 Tax=Stutzerimonas stutzeri TaxID=316 RepID=UPI00163A630E|nr:hypothetical protein [Stutzerimonas stutzeri]